jgi:hypothetical protein
LDCYDFFFGFAPIESQRCPVNFEEFIQRGDCFRREFLGEGERDLERVMQRLG